MNNFFELWIRQHACFEMASSRILNAVLKKVPELAAIEANTVIKDSKLHYQGLFHFKAKTGPHS